MTTTLNYKIPKELNGAVVQIVFKLDSHPITLEVNPIGVLILSRKINNTNEDYEGEYGMIKLVPVASQKMDQKLKKIQQEFPDGWTPFVRYIPIERIKEILELQPSN